MSVGVQRRALVSDGPASGWSVTLAGGFALAHAGARVRLPLSAQRVIAFLALHSRPVLRGYVASTLWMDQPEEQAAANLRTALWRLRKECDELVDVARNQLEIAETTDIDIRTAEQVARGARLEQSSRGSTLETQTLLHDLLPDWDDEWVCVERERFRQLRLHALEALCLRFTALRDFPAAVEAGVAAVSAEPLRESAQHVLIAAHLAEHNTAEAVRQYDRYRALLRSELDVAPSADLGDLLSAHGLAR